MNSQENLSLRGRLNIVVTAEDGSIKDSREVDNLVVTAGLGYIASRMKDATATAMSHMAVGIGGATATAATQTVLSTESARVTIAASTAGSTNVVFTATFAAGTPAGTTALTEAGIFNAASAGTMLCRTTFPVINKAPNDTMTITWTINLTAS